MIYVVLESTFRQSTYIFMRLQCSHSSGSKYLTRRIIISLAFCEHHGWHLPQQFFNKRSFYYYFVNKTLNFYALKHINKLFKSNRLAVKSLHTHLLASTIGHTIIFFQIAPSHKCFRQLCPREKSQVLVKVNQTICVAP